MIIECTRCGELFPEFEDVFLDGTVVELDTFPICEECFRELIDSGIQIEDMI